MIVFGHWSISRLPVACGVSFALREDGIGGGRFFLRILSKFPLSFRDFPPIVTCDAFSAISPFRRFFPFAASSIRRHLIRCHIYIGRLRGVSIDALAEF